MFRHLKENAETKEIWLDSVNGHAEHIHCLVSMNKDKSISEIVRLIKGESSFWINKSKLVRQKFAWQDDYWAVSVSESHLEKIREYIYQQEDHHRSRSFAEEVQEFMEKYGWNIIKEG